MNKHSSVWMLFSIVAMIVASGAFGQQGSRRPMLDIYAPGAGLARVADANGDGELAAEEWTVFLEALRPDEAGVVDRRLVKARLLSLDVDGDGTLTMIDLEQALTVSDSEGERRRWRGFLVPFASALADTDENGQVSAAERDTLLDESRPASGEAIEESVVIEWMRRAESFPPPEDINAFTPGVILATLDSSLDVDADGRVTLTDLGALHAGLDANGDGKLDAQELTPRRRGGGTDEATGYGQWKVTDAMRARPPLMPWQRSLADALALAEATGKPLLICVNTDGENASESLAWGRYRDPEFVELARGFVPILASPDRREPHERDDRGRRLPDRRFGRLVNSEHIDEEPVLFERYFDGNRVAPRHVGVSPDGEILFDVFLVQDLSVVDEKLREFGVQTPATPEPKTLSEEDLLASPDAANRDELERRFVVADERTRARLAGLALSSVRETQHPELVGLALRDPAAAVRRQGVWAMIQHPGVAPLDHVPAAFTTVADEPDLHTALVAALRRAVEEVEDEERKASTAFYLRVYSTLGRPSVHVDVDRWRLALASAPPLPESAPTAEDFDATADLLAALDTALAFSSDDLELLVQHAATQMRFARVHLAMNRNPSFFFEDTITACERGLEVAPEDGRLLGLHAWASYMLSDMEKAGTMAARALPRLVRDAGSPLAAEVLNVFATVRSRTLYAAIAAGEAWPADAIPDVVAAYEVLLDHPAGTEAHWKAFLNLYGALYAYGAQAELVRRGLRRFPASAEMHLYLRFQVLRDVGARALEAAYDEEAALVPEELRPTFDWFHGLGTLVAAEWDVGRRDPDAAMGAYERSRLLFQRALDASPDFVDSATHYQCLALAGLARLQADAGLLREAVDHLVTAVRTSPASVEIADGLGKSPSDSALEVLRRLSRAGNADLAYELRERLADAGLTFSTIPGPGSP